MTAEQFPEAPPLDDYTDNARAAVPTPVREEPDPEAKPT